MQRVSRRYCCRSTEVRGANCRDGAVSEVNVQRCRGVQVQGGVQRGAAAEVHRKKCRCRVAKKMQR